MTQQQKKRKELLAQSLFELLKHEAIEKITVDQICHVAEVHRSTFYRYFRDKYDLMHFAFEKLMLARIEGEHFVDAMIEMILKNKEVFRNISINNNNNTLYWIMVDMLSQQLLDAQKEGRLHELEWIGNEIKLSIAPLLAAKMYAGAFLTIIFEWINSNYQMDPQELSLFIKNLHK